MQTQNVHGPRRSECSVMRSCWCSVMPPCAIGNVCANGGHDPKCVYARSVRRRCTRRRPGVAREPGAVLASVFAAGRFARSRPGAVVLVGVPRGAVAASGCPHWSSGGRQRNLVLDVGHSHPDPRSAWSPSARLGTLRRSIARRKRIPPGGLFECCATERGAAEANGAAENGADGAPGGAGTETKNGRWERQGRGERPEHDFELHGCGAHAAAAATPA